MNTNKQGGESPTKTPRTDHIVNSADGTLARRQWVEADFARELERDLTAAQATIAELRELVREVADIPLTEEVPGIAAKFPEMDELVCKARALRHSAPVAKEGQQ